MTDHSPGDMIENAHGEKRQADHEQAGDGAAIEGHAQSGAPAGTGGLGGAGISQDGDAHADVAGRE